MENLLNIRDVVREKYGQAARGESCCGTSGCCGASNVEDIATAIGYSEDDLNAVPEGANLGLGCGNPLQFADVKPGETVLDLGSGAGFDAFLAWRKVGPLGRVIGVDMTPDMLAKARANAETLNAKNVEFREGIIEDLPLKDCAVDLVISNCVINLSTDKRQVFREITRVLRPGGRMLVSDLVLNRPLSDELKNNIEAYVGCVAGASLKDEYITYALEAGLTQVEIVNEIQYDVGLDSIGDTLRKEALEAISSVKVRAYKPQDYDCCAGDCCK